MELVMLVNRVVGEPLLTIVKMTQVNHWNRCYQDLTMELTEWWGQILWEAWGKTRMNDDERPPLGTLNPYLDKNG